MNKLCFFAHLHLCVRKKTLYLLILILAASSIFAQAAFQIKDKRLNEISGIIASRVNPDLFYVHNDSGGRNEVYVLDAQGKSITTLILAGVTNRDWEDIAAGPGPDKNKSYIYVGETGDNKARYPNVSLYRFSEPHLAAKGKSRQKSVIIPAEQVEKFSFSFEDGARDCEALFVDPQNGDVYLVSKREEKVGLYQIKSPLSETGINVARRISEFGFALAVAADISSNRDKILIKTYTNIYCWNVLPDQTIAEALAMEPVKLPYVMEPQGEAICWTTDGTKYLTISEKSWKKPLFLYIYPFITSDNK
jgi:hypothetical protein